MDATHYCQCEHVIHPAEEDATQEELARKDHAHTYGIFTEPGDLILVKTVWGDYHICKACQAHHPIPEDYLCD